MQQHLPLAVLKLFSGPIILNRNLFSLQQHLPLAVLKLSAKLEPVEEGYVGKSCNSTYRLRYWNSVKATTVFCFVVTVATVLTACGIETFGISMIIPTEHGLQQYLPLAVLKHDTTMTASESTVTEFGCNSTYRLRYWNLWASCWAILL